MRFRGRWRGFLDAGPVLFVGKRIALDRVVMRAFDGLFTLALGGGARRALNESVDLYLRASMTLPRSLQYGASGVCPFGGDGGADAVLEGEATSWSAFAEAGVRLRLGALFPVYLGVGALVGAQWFVDTRSALVFCRAPGTPADQPSDRFAVSTGVSMVPLFGGSGSVGVQFGAREQFEFNFQTGYVYHGRAAQEAPPGRENVWSVGFILVHLNFGWAFS